MSQTLEEFRTLARKSIEKCIGEPEDAEVVDLEYLFQTTKALIKTNNEIIDRCEPSRRKVAGEQRKLKYEREFIMKAEARHEAHHNEVGPWVEQSLYTNYDERRSEFAFVFNFERGRESKYFVLPEDDCGKLFVPPKRGDIPYLIDYNAYLEKAVVLDDATLAPFLTRLKHHLEDMQVMLGTIESWLAHPDAVTEFLSSRFQFSREDALTKKNSRSLPIPHSNKAVRIPYSSQGAIATFHLTEEDGFDTMDHFLSLIRGAGSGASLEKRKRDT